MSGWASLGGILGGAGSILGDILSYQSSKRNYDLEKSKYEYDQKLQERIFDREDSAVQRRVADLKAAGLSPVLAAGSGADAGTVVTTKAPQMDFPDLKSPQAIMQMMEFKRQLDMTEEQKKLIKQQVQNAKTENVQKQLDTAVKAYDFQRAKDAGVSYNASGWAKDVKEIIGVGFGPFQEIKKAWKEGKRRAEVLDKAREKGYKGEYKQLRKVKTRSRR